MKWQDSKASECRWSSYAEELVYDWDILWDNSYADYQGSAEFFAYKDGKFAYMYWSYGSCSGCDGYEDLSDEEVRDAFKSNIEYFDSYLEFARWVESRGNKEMTDALSEYRKAFDDKFHEDFETYNVN